MTKSIFTLFISLFIISCGGSKDKNKNSDNQSKLSVLIKGSDTVLPLAQKFAEVYMKNNPGANVTIIGGGSGVGIAALMDGTTDIAMSSRPIKADEKIKLSKMNKEVTELIIANDALSVVVHNSNPVSELTREQLEEIFTGKISNWKDVGGKDLKIIYYSRETSSGTYEFFRDHVLNKKNFGNKALLMPATGAIVQSISQTEGAIGYIGLAYDTKDVKPLKISYDQGKTFVMPSIDSARDKSYPISRPLYFYFETKLLEKYAPFFDYMKSDEGQSLVREVGYVPLQTS
ncbi:MAG: phosphate ABC transporter substrate-binding protein [Bacteroidetes bacterium]|nr:MAG: phosphate ABC transporter substrate-binding protein [Bacteroidota bacterium]REJ99820.1 MAG: phosphate ABC transporter substrate-binding protein [Bacteroidota bacterium]REK34193.1 MAG: phosphate ABC transporter substrate-binding protein [Bacteroidota bacterium]REK50523.1 MAG: phosphate ABC transporter substrate-binding protein [Bacteroidota bacterium]